MLWCYRQLYLRKSFKITHRRTNFLERGFLQNVRFHILAQIYNTYINTFHILLRLVVLRERLDAKSQFKLDLGRLEAIVKKTVDRDWSEGQKYIEKGHIDRGKKTLIRIFSCGSSAVAF